VTSSIHRFTLHRSPFTVYRLPFTVSPFEVMIFSKKEFRMNGGNVNNKKE